MIDYDQFSASNTPSVDSSAVGNIHVALKLIIIYHSIANVYKKVSQDELFKGGAYAIKRKKPA